MASRRDRFRGVLLGTALGDALGMPVEGWPREAILRTHGVVRDMLPARLGAGTYTDDTQMAIALAEALIETPGRLDPDVVAERFGARYESRRGYGGNTHRILRRIAAGEAWRGVVEETRLPGGSWANGAAMRVAPLALAFPSDPEAVMAAAAAQAEVTGHTHPVGLAGARLQALAVQAALEVETGCLRPESFVDGLVGAADWPDEVKSRLAWIRDRPDADADDAVDRLGVGVRASASVPAALWAFLSAAGAAEDVVVQAVGLGGDTDTVGAMAGALAGAYQGAEAFPDRWTGALEDEDAGRGYLLELADRLYELS